MKYVFWIFFWFINGWIKKVIYFEVINVLKLMIIVLLVFSFIFKVESILRCVIKWKVFWCWKFEVFILFEIYNWFICEIDVVCYVYILIYFFVYFLDCFKCFDILIEYFIYFIFLNVRMMLWFYCIRIGGMLGKVVDVCL